MEEDPILVEMTYPVGAIYRAAVMFYVLIVLFPALLLERLIHRKHMLIFLLFMPFKLLTIIVSSYPLDPKFDYTLILREASLRFGPRQSLMANAYGSIYHIDKLFGRHFLLMRDGWLVFLPSNSQATCLPKIAELRNTAHQLFPPDAI